MAFRGRVLFSVAESRSVTGATCDDEALISLFWDFILLVCLVII